MIKVGVFDSGVGGLSVVNAIEKALPDIEVVYAQDKENVPYGLKDPATLLSLVTPIVQSLIDKGCEVIVLACNTVSTTLAPELRERFDVPFVALEPMVKPAAVSTQTGIFAVCATPTTLASKRYEWLKNEYAQGKKIIEPDCSDWSEMIEANKIDREKIKSRIVEACKKGADVIVLGCTHYHWIEEEIKEIASEYGAQVIQPEQAVVAQLRRVISQLS